MVSGGAVTFIVALSAVLGSPSPWDDGKRGNTIQVYNKGCINPEGGEGMNSTHSTDRTHAE